MKHDGSDHFFAENFGMKVGKRCRTHDDQLEDDAPRTQEELDAALSSIGLDWQAAQRILAPSLGVDPGRLGTLEEATMLIGAAWPGALQGSERHSCDSCNAALALSPISAQAVEARPNLRVLCLKCALEAQSQERDDDEPTER